MTSPAMWSARIFVARRILCPLAMRLVRLAIACEGHKQIRSPQLWRRLGQNCAYVGWADSNGAFASWVETWGEVDGE